MATAAATPADPSLSVNCSICLDPMSDRVFVVPCKHDFDKSCIQEWRSVDPTCPYCRGPISGLRDEAGNVTQYNAPPVGRTRFLVPAPSSISGSFFAHFDPFSHPVLTQPHVYPPGHSTAPSIHSQSGPQQMQPLSFLSANPYQNTTAMYFDPFGPSSSSSSSSPALDADSSGISQQAYNSGYAASGSAAPTASAGAAAYAPLVATISGAMGTMPRPRNSASYAVRSYWNQRPSCRVQAPNPNVRMVRAHHPVTMMPSTTAPVTTMQMPAFPGGPVRPFSAAMSGSPAGMEMNSMPGAGAGVRMRMQMQPAASLGVPMQRLQRIGRMPGPPGMGMQPQTIHPNLMLQRFIAPGNPAFTAQIPPPVYRSRGNKRNRCHVTATATSSSSPATSLSSSSASQQPVAGVAFNSPLTLPAAGPSASIENLNASQSFAASALVSPEPFDPLGETLVHLSEIEAEDSEILDAMITFAEMESLSNPQPHQMPFPPHQASTSSTPSGVMCSICKQEMTDRAVVIPCFHEFDFKCVNSLATPGSSCPRCDRDMEAIHFNINAEDSYSVKQVLMFATLSQRGSGFQSTSSSTANQSSAVATAGADLQPSASGIRIKKEDDDEEVLCLN